MRTIDATYQAYALGYHHGRTTGAEDNPYEGDLRYAYARGFEAGVADYCREVLCE